MMANHYFIQVLSDKREWIDLPGQEPIYNEREARDLAVKTSMTLMRITRVVKEIEAIP